MRISRILVAFASLLSCGHAFAAASAQTEPNNCSGPYQLFIYTWNFTSPHDTWGNYAAWVKLTASQSYLNVNHASSEPLLCKNIGRGIPLGNAGHHWRSTGTSGSSTIHTNVVTITNNEECQPNN